MTQHNQNRPFHVVPQGILALVILVGAMEVLFSVGEMNLGIASNEDRWRISAILYHGMLVDQLRVDLTREWTLLVSASRVLTYSFIGWSLADSLISVVFLLAVGNYASFFLDQTKVLSIYAAATIAGALGYLAFYTGELPLIGPSPGIFGLFGSLFALAILPLKLPTEIRTNLFRMPLIMVALQVGLGIFWSDHIVWIPILVGFVAGFLMTILVIFGLRAGIYFLATFLAGTRRD